MKNRYPRRLLPKHNYILIPDAIIKNRMTDFFLVRRIKRDDTIPDFRNRLKSQFLPTTFKKGISVVLLSVFKKEDIGWCCRKPCGQIKKYECKWEDKNRKTIFPKNKHLKYDKHVTLGGYKIGELFQYQADNPVLVKDNNGNERERPDEVRLKVIHEPIYINYWHCEIMLYGVNGDDKSVYDFSNKQAERAGNIILDDLADLAYSCEDTESKILKKRVYKSNVVNAHHYGNR